MAATPARRRKPRKNDAVQNDAPVAVDAPVPAPAEDDLAAEPIGRRLARLGCDPIAVIAAIACDEAADARLRLAAAKELAAYLMSKPRGASAPATAVDVAAIIARGWAPDADAGEGAP